MLAVNRELERVNELVADGNESVLGDLIFNLQAGLLGVGVVEFQL